MRRKLEKNPLQDTC